MLYAFLSIFIVGLVGGAVPLARRWSDRWHHAALAFSAGVFLGAVFLHLLPSVASGGTHDHAAHAVEADAHAGHDHSGHDHSGHDHSGHDHPTQDDAADGHEGHDHADEDAHAGHAHGPIHLWLWVLVGVLGVFLIEALLLPGTTHGHGHSHDDQGRHLAVGYAALVGLTIHALTAGVALAAVQSQEALAGVMLVAILAHKGFESFSLASVFGLSGVSRRKIVALVVGFSLVTPVGLLLGSRLTDVLGPDGVGIMTALATGTFLYVCLCELLPEVFHRREDGPWKIGLLVLGIGVMWWAHSVGGI